MLQPRASAVWFDRLLCGYVSTQAVLFTNLMQTYSQCYAALNVVNVGTLDNACPALVYLQVSMFCSQCSGLLSHTQITHAVTTGTAGATACFGGRAHGCSLTHSPSGACQTCGTPRQL